MRGYTVLKLTSANVAHFLVGRDWPELYNAAPTLMICCNDKLVKLSQSKIVLWPKKTSLHHLLNLTYNTCILGKQWFRCFLQKRYLF